jgi:hypothetical protein
MLSNVIPARKLYVSDVSGEFVQKIEEAIGADNVIKISYDDYRDR